MKFVLKKNANVPRLATEGSIGYDLSSNENVTIGPHETKFVETDVGIDFEQDALFAEILGRSGLAMKKIQVFHGLIDPDYQGTIKVGVFNLSSEPFEIKENDRIAQLVFRKKEPVEKIEVVEEFLVKTERGENGFGSTGTAQTTG